MNTTLKSKANAGDITVDLVNADGFNRGCRIIIGEGQDHEENMVKERNLLRLHSPLKKNWDIGTKASMRKHNGNKVAQHSSGTRDKGC
jgi:hypothetical protein